MNAVDKYEYKQLSERMIELMQNEEYGEAKEIADSIDWRRVRNAMMLANVSDIYEKTGEYQKSYDILQIAYHRAEGSRKVLYRLSSLALKTGNVDEAIDFYDEFVQLAPKDPNRHILRYQILRAQRAPLEQQIEALEEFKKAEYIEEWAFELAKLYQEAGMTAECLEECDDLILWFSEGKYVYKAMELKMQYKPLTPSQQEKYNRRFEKNGGRKRFRILRRMLQKMKSRKIIWMKQQRSIQRLFQKSRLRTFLRVLDSRIQEKKKVQRNQSVSRKRKRSVIQCGWMRHWSSYCIASRKYLRQRMKSRIFLILRVRSVILSRSWILIW